MKRTIFTIFKPGFAPLNLTLIRFLALAGDWRDDG
jgi:hypothetical protein